MNGKLSDKRVRAIGKPHKKPPFFLIYSVDQSVRYSKKPHPAQRNEKAHSAAIRRNRLNVSGFSSGADVNSLFYKPVEIDRQESAWVRYNGTQ